MQDSRKVLKSVLIFAISILVILSVLVVSFCNLETYYYDDVHAREELAGDIDILIVGASQSQTAFVPSVMNEKLGCHAYNLSGSATTWYGRRALLMEEIDRNPIKKVIIDISYDNMYREPTSLEGDLYVIPRLNSWGKRIEYLRTCCNPDDYDMLLSEMVQRGGVALTKYLRALITNISTDSPFRNAYSESSMVDRELRGYMRCDSNDVTIEESEIADKYNSELINLEWNERNEQIFLDMVAECHSREIDVEVVVVPVSDSIIWTLDGWDDFHEKVRVLSEENNCTFTDYNLCRDRYDMYRDNDSYRDVEHLSEKGAYRFTEKYCDMKLQGLTGSELYYDSYNTLTQSSPYVR